MTEILIDGERADASISAYDEGLLRGDGCFEAIRAYAGASFAFDAHYQRLTCSAAALDLPCPSGPALRSWVDEMAAEGGDCIVRVVLTRGGDRVPARCLVLWHQVPLVHSELRLKAVPAPWHPGGEPWELSGVKTISYAPNMAASRLARQHGYHDALLISSGGFVLEGPTFAIAWVRGGVVETPTLDLGILDSVTSRLLLRAAAEDGFEVHHGRFNLEVVGEATEVFAMSTVKEVAPVAAVDDWAHSAGPISRHLAARYRELIAAEKEEVRA